MRWAGVGAAAPLAAEHRDCATLEQDVPRGPSPQRHRALAVRSDKRRRWTESGPEAEPEKRGVFLPSPCFHDRLRSAGQVKILLGEERGPLEPRLGGEGAAERGSKGHKPFSSIQMPEILPPTIAKGGGAGSAYSQGTSPPPPVPVARNAGTL